MVSSTSATLRFPNDLVDFAKGMGNLGAKRFVAEAALVHCPALYGSLDPQQGAFNAIHGFFEGLTAHGSQGVAE